MDNTVKVAHFQINGDFHVFENKILYSGQRYLFTNYKRDLHSHKLPKQRGQNMHPILR
jgi:regulatory protein YycI of two-component signal transduction system YycFG